MRADSNTVSGGVKGPNPNEVTKMENVIQSRLARILLCAVAIPLMIAVTGGRADGQEHKAVNLAPARGLPFSDAIVVGDTAYIAGQEGTDESGKLASGGIGPETGAALDNIQKTLKAAGFEMKDIVSVTVYLADIHEFPDMNKVYKSVMPDPKPARATVQVAALVNGARIEVSAIAVKGK
jgi:2-iminobutanoate/2-iminopropanoate deaminase